MTENSKKEPEEYTEPDFYGRGHHALFGKDAETIGIKQAKMRMIHAREARSGIKATDNVDYDLYGRGDPRIFGKDSHLITKKLASDYLLEAQQKRARILSDYMFPAGSGALVRIGRDIDFEVAEIESPTKNPVDQDTIEHPIAVASDSKEVEQQKQADYTIKESKNESKSNGSIERIASDHLVNTHVSTNKMEQQIQEAAEKEVKSNTVDQQDALMQNDSRRDKKAQPTTVSENKVEETREPNYQSREVSAIISSYETLTSKFNLQDLFSDADHARYPPLRKSINNAVTVGPQAPPKQEDRYISPSEPRFNIVPLAKQSSDTSSASHVRDVTESDYSHQLSSTGSFSSNQNNSSSDTDSNVYTNTNSSIVNSVSSTSSQSNSTVENISSSSSSNVCRVHGSISLDAGSDSGASSAGVAEISQVQTSTEPIFQKTQVVPAETAIAYQMTIPVTAIKSSEIMEMQHISKTSPGDMDALSSPTTPADTVNRANMLTSDNRGNSSNILDSDCQKSTANMNSFMDDKNEDYDMNAKRLDILQDNGATAQDSTIHRNSNATSYARMNDQSHVTTDSTSQDQFASKSLAIRNGDALEDAHPFKRLEHLTYNASSSIEQGGRNSSDAISSSAEDLGDSSEVVDDSNDSMAESRSSEQSRNETRGILDQSSTENNNLPGPGGVDTNHQNSDNSAQTHAYESSDSTSTDQSLSYSSDSQTSGTNSSNLPIRAVVDSDQESVSTSDMYLDAHET